MKTSAFQPVPISLVAARSKARGIVLLAALVLAACGSGSGTSEDVADATAAGSDGPVAASAGADEPECRHDAYEGEHVLAVLDADGRFDLFICLVESVWPPMVDFFTSPLDKSHRFMSVGISAAETTLFAPTDDALAAFGRDRLDALMAEDRATVAVDGLSVTSRAIVQYHLFGEVLPESDLATGTYPTLSNFPVDVVVDGPDIRVGDATVLEELETPHGAAYAVDGLIGLPRRTPE